MNVSVENLDLYRYVFSRRDSRLYLTVDEKTNENGYRIFLSVSRDDPGGVRYDLIQLAPTYKGERIAFEYTAVPWLLNLKTQYGVIELCYEPQIEALQARASGGLGLDLFIPFSAHDMCVDRLDGSLEIGFGSMGQFLIEAAAGAQTHDSRWIGPRMQSTPTTVRWEPQGEKLLGYVLWDNAYVEKPALHDFDWCASKNRKDYEYWMTQLPPVPKEYETLREIGGYVFWISHQKPLLRMKEPIMYMMRCGVLQRGTAWQQCDHAMACWRNQSFVSEILHSFFSLQDSYGMIPDNINDRDVSYISTKPPFHGFALTWILNHLGEENVEKELCENLYEPLCKWVDWWRCFRDGDKDGLMAYMHGDECGLDDASVFSGGVPVVSPDLQAYLALCMEVCGRLARILGFSEKAERHFQDSEELITRMIEKLWNGKKFVCMLEKDKKIVDTASIVCYVPVILGKRLPAEIMDRMTKDLLNPELFWSENGIRSESVGSPYYDASMPGPFALGMCMAVSQLFAAVGFYDAGRFEAAAKVAKCWCSRSLQNGYITTDIVELDQRIEPEEGGEYVYNATSRYPGKFNSWGVPVFFVLAEILKETERREV